MLGHTEDDDNDEEFDNFAPKAQILLVCCWRAMKEVSLLLGEITKRAPVKKNDQSSGLLTFRQVYAVSDACDISDRLMLNICIHKSEQVHYICCIATQSTRVL